MSQVPHYDSELRLGLSTGVVFSAKIRLREGEGLWVTGDAACLGHWEWSKGVELKQTTDDASRWVAIVRNSADLAGKKFSYVLVQSNLTHVFEDERTREVGCHPLSTPGCPHEPHFTRQCTRPPGQSPNRRGSTMKLDVTHVPRASLMAPQELRKARVPLTNQPAAGRDVFINKVDGIASKSCCELPDVLSATDISSLKELVTVADDIFKLKETFSNELREWQEWFSSTAKHISTFMADHAELQDKHQQMKAQLATVATREAETRQMTAQLDARTMETANLLHKYKDVEERLGVTTRKIDTLVHQELPPLKGLLRDTASNVDRLGKWTEAELRDTERELQGLLSSEIEPMKTQHRTLAREFFQHCNERRPAARNNMVCFGGQRGQREQDPPVPDIPAKLEFLTQEVQTFKSRVDMLQSSLEDFKEASPGVAMAAATRVLDGALMAFQAQNNDVISKMERKSCLRQPGACFQTHDTADAATSTSSLHVLLQLQSAILDAKLDELTSRLHDTFASGQSLQDAVAQMVPKSELEAALKKQVGICDENYTHLEGKVELLVANLESSIDDLRRSSRKRNTDQDEKTASMAAEVNEVRSELGLLRKKVEDELKPPGRQQTAFTERPAPDICRDSPSQRVVEACAACGSIEEGLCARTHELPDARGAASKRASSSKSTRSQASRESLERAVDASAKPVGTKLEMRSHEHEEQDLAGGPQEQAQQATEPVMLPRGASTMWSGMHDPILPGAATAHRAMNLETTEAILAPITASFCAKQAIFSTTSAAATSTEPAKAKAQQDSQVQAAELKLAASPGNSSSTSAPPAQHSSEGLNGGTAQSPGMHAAMAEEIRHSAAGNKRSSSRTSTRTTGMVFGGLGKRNGPIFNNPAHPACPEAQGLTLHIEKKIMKYLAEVKEQSQNGGSASQEVDGQRFLKERYLELHPDKNSGKEAYKAAFQWFQEWLEMHRDWFMHKMPKSPPPEMPKKLE